MSRIIRLTLLQIRNFSFKRPPPNYGFKRQIVPSDFDGSLLKDKFDVDTKKWCKNKVEIPKSKNKNKSRQNNKD
jgi:hypothetical protein